MKNTSADAARQYLFSDGYLGDSFPLPGYFKVSNLENIDLDDIEWDNKPPLITEPIALTQPKGKYGVRQFEILNPYAYIHLVNLITSLENWATFTELLCTPTAVRVYSLPFLGGDEDRKIYRQAFKYFDQKDIIINSLNYEVLAKTDLANFYKTVYTHSLSWAIHGKSLAKKGRRDSSLLGNRLDKLVQNSMSGQTNGLPIGTVISHVLAEVVLKKVDKKISPHLTKLNIEAFRFRDDYRFLCKSEVDARKILEVLGETLNSEFNLTLNDQKTHISRNPVRSSTKSSSNNSPAIYECLKLIKEEGKISSDLFTELLTNIHSSESLNKSFLKHVILALLSTDESKVDIEVSEEDVREQVAMLKSLMDSFGEISPEIFALIDKILSSLNQDDLCSEIVESLYESLRFSDNSIGEIWLHRLAHRWNPDIKESIEQRSSSNPLIALVSMNEPHYWIFDNPSFSSRDKLELEKFMLFMDEEFEAAKDEWLEVEPFLWFVYD